MRKGTKKKIIHGILIIFVIIFALMASLIAAFRDITVQSMIARSVAGELSRKLNTEVKIKTFYITTNLYLCIEDVQVNDLEGYPMFEIGKINARFAPMMTFDDIRVKDVYFENVMGRLVKYEDSELLNIKDIISQFGGGKGKKTEEKNESGFRLRIDNMRLDNGHVIFWNQHKDDPDRLSMDYAHIDIDSIYGVFSNLEIRNDSVLGNVHTLKGKDRCGLVLDDARGDVLFCEKCLNIDNLILETNESHVDLDLRFEYESSSAYYEFEDSVRIIGNIRQSTLLLSDLKYFAWVLSKMPDKFVFTAQYDGPVSDFTVSDVDLYYANSTHLEADVTMTGLPDFETTYMDVSIKRLVTSYDDMKNTAIPSESVTVPLPDALNPMGMCSFSGTYSGYANDFSAKANLISDMGDVYAYVYLNTTDNPEYSFNIVTNRLNFKELVGLKDEAEVSMEFSLNGKGLEVKDTDFEADVKFNSLVLYGNEFNDFTVHGDFENQRFIAMTKLAHPHVGLDLSAMLDLNGKMPSYNIKADIKDADLVKLKLIDNDTVMVVSSLIDLQFTGDDIDNITGKLDIENTKFYNGDEYTMMDFSASVTEFSGIKDIEINCDFFDFYSSGIINFKTFANAMKNTAKRYVNIPAWFGNTIPDTNKQEFSLSLNLKDTRQLSKLFIPELYVSRGTTVTATYTDGYAYHGSTIESPEVWYNNLKFKNLEIRNTGKFDEFLSDITFDDIIIRDTTSTNPDPISLENVVVQTKFANDTILIDLQWDDDIEEDRNKAHIKSMFVPHPKSGGLLTIKSDEIVVNDTLWALDPNCVIDFQKTKTFINDFELYTNTQSMKVNGVYPKRNQDTLMVTLKNVDVSDFDFITVGNDLDFDGIVTGFVGFSGLDEQLAFSSILELKEFYLNKQEVGDVFVNTKWVDESKSIYINSEIYNSLFENEQHESVRLNGYYSPMRRSNNLNFNLKFDKFKLETVSPFISKVVNRMNGYASGNARIRGSFSEPEFMGKVSIIDAGCKINYLNTYYTFSNDIDIQKDKIVIDNMIINDTLGNTASLNGMIRHNYLRDFDFDLSLKCNDFLALNIPVEQAEGFYGSAVADGTVLISGPIDNIVMNIEAVTKKGTVIDIPLSGTNTINNDFIVFVRREAESDTLVETYVPEVSKEKGSFTMDLMADVNPDAAVNIFLPQNMGNISARGAGNIKIDLDGDDFNLRGDYVINNGVFNFTLQMVKRTFTLREGGTLRWTGDPADADIDIVGVYRTKSSLTSLGSSLVDSTALTNNINVDCIIRLSDKLMNPTITFGLELPNAKEDTKNLVFSIIDTTNQAVMAQQVFSLMVLGSFSYTAGSNIARFGTTAGYSVITNQLSNWLSQISKDFDIGINYTPNDQLTNEELEVALSTQLFDDRLTIEGNFGVIRGNKSDASQANNIVGDVDLTLKITKRLSFKAYNHTNVKNNYYYYSFENYSDFTQGIGISFSQSFDNIREIFTFNKKNKANKTKLKLDEKPKTE